LQLLAIQALLIVSIQSQAQSASGLSQDCREFINEIEKDGWSWGITRVPRDWSKAGKPFTATIPIFFYFDATRDKNAAIPILQLNGGPFFSAKGRRKALSDNIRKFDRDKNHLLIMMDQRGVGCSAPLKDIDKMSISRLRSYAPESIVRDAEHIRKKIFHNKKWKLYGQSYGGTIAKRYVGMFPNSLLDVHVHVHGGVLHNNLVDFFFMRTLRMNFVLDKFLDFYSKDDLYRAFDIIHSEDGQSICVPGDGINKHPVCGPALLDAIVEAIGLGKGTSADSDAIWENVRETLLLLIDGDVDAFLIKAESSLNFFRSSIIVPVFTVWSQDLKMNRDLDENCFEGHRILQQEYGIDDPMKLPLNHCRVILQAIPDSFKKKLRDGYKAPIDFVSQDRLLDILNIHSSGDLRFFLYTGELDSFTQNISMQRLIYSPLVDHTHFQSGHLAYLFEEDIFKNLVSFQ
jgi:pimeloyl-ACP methyl ester carboxylesterase